MVRAKTTHDSSPNRRSYLGSRPASGNGRDCPPKAAGKEPQRRRVAHATRKQATPSSGLGRATAKRRRLLTQEGRRSCTKIRTVTTIAACRSRSEEHTSELQSLMRISYAVFCLKKKNQTQEDTEQQTKRNK